MMAPVPPVRILFIFGWLVVGGEETEVRLLARNLHPERYKIDVIACFHKPGMPSQTHEQLVAAGVNVDTTPYTLSFEDTVSYLANKIAGYDVLVSCQNVADIYPALERLHLHPPLIEHGGLVSEALAGPKHFTSRYVGVCRSIRDAAAEKMPGREDHAVEIPSMVDLTEFDPSQRERMRRDLGIDQNEILIGWVGRLDPKKNVEDFIEAAALVRAKNPEARFVIVGGPDAFLPDYAGELKSLAAKRGLSSVLAFLGDRQDIPALLSAFDIFVWLSRGEGMPHVIAEAGAAGLPVIATPDNGAAQQITNDISGLFVPYNDPPCVASALRKLIDDSTLRDSLGGALRQSVHDRYSAVAVVPQWEALIEEVILERRSAGPTGIFQSFLQEALSVPHIDYALKMADPTASGSISSHPLATILMRLKITSSSNGFRYGPFVTACDGISSSRARAITTGPALYRCCMRRDQHAPKSSGISCTTVGRTKSISGLRGLSSVSRSLLRLQRRLSLRRAMMCRFIARLTRSRFSHGPEAMLLISTPSLAVAASN